MAARQWLSSFPIHNTFDNHLTFKTTFGINMVLTGSFHYLTKYVMKTTHFFKYMKFPQSHNISSYWEWTKCKRWKKVWREKDKNKAPQCFETGPGMHMLRKGWNQCFQEVHSTEWCPYQFEHKYHMYLFDPSSALSGGYTVPPHSLCLMKVLWSYWKVKNLLHVVKKCQYLWKGLA